MKKILHTVFALVRDNEVYVGKTRGTRISAVFSRHRCGDHTTTRQHFAKPKPQPGLHILYRGEMPAFVAYKYTLAFIRLFREAGYHSLNAPHTIARSDDLKDDTQNIFKEIKTDNIAILLQSTRVEKVTDADMPKETDAGESQGETQSCQLTIRLTATEKEQFQQLSATLNLTQREVLLYLFAKCNQTDPVFLDLEGDLYLRVLIDSYREENQRLKNQNIELKKKLSLLRVDIKNKLARVNAHMRALQKGIREYFQLLESTSKIPVDLEVDYYEDFPNKNLYQYPEDEGFYIFRPQEILRSKGRWGAIFLVGIGDNNRLYRFRYYKKSYYAGENIANSSFAKRGSVWLVGCERAADGAMDIVYAFPLEVRFQFNGPEEYGSQMNRDIAKLIKEIDSYQDF